MIRGIKSGKFKIEEFAGKKRRRIMISKKRQSKDKNRELFKKLSKK